MLLVLIIILAYLIIGGILGNIFAEDDDSAKFGFIFFWPLMMIIVLLVKIYEITDESTRKIIQWFRNTFHPCEKCAIRDNHLYKCSANISCGRWVKKKDGVK